MSWVSMEWSHSTTAFDWAQGLSTVGIPTGSCNGGVRDVAHPPGIERDTMKSNKEIGIPSVPVTEGIPIRQSLNSFTVEWVFLHIISRNSRLGELYHLFRRMKWKEALEGDGSSKMIGLHTQPKLSSASREWPIAVRAWDAEFYGISKQGISEWVFLHIISRNSRLGELYHLFRRMKWKEALEGDGSSKMIGLHTQPKLSSASREWPIAVRAWDAEFYGISKQGIYLK